MRLATALIVSIVFLLGYRQLEAKRLEEIEETFASTAAVVATVDPRIRARIAQAAKPAYLVIGDSNTAGAPLRPIAGIAPVNAGIAGARVETFLGLAPDYAAALKPEIVVVALGVNDSFFDREAEFRNAFGALLDGLAGYRVAVSLIPAIEPRKMAAGLHPGLEAIDRFNRIERAEAERRGVPVIEQPAPTTTDGLHLDPRSYLAWRGVIEAHVAAAVAR